MMSDAINDFARQFAYVPRVEYAKKMKKNYARYIVTGMGGSRLPALILSAWKPMLPLVIWNDYSLPNIPTAERAKTLVVVSSYSGNTEEALDGLTVALKKHVPVAVIAIGGKLLEIAKKKKLPFVELPDTGIQPRSALGFSLRGLLAILHDTHGLKETAKLAKELRPELLKPKGKELASMLKNRVPVIYTSRANLAIAYNWKIKLNETGKIPAFYNILPELNHNEMTGFDVKPASKHLSNCFSFIFIEDPEDHPQIKRRLAVVKKLYEERELPVHVLTLSGKTFLEKTFHSLLLADWTAVALAESYGLESEQVPMVEEFKKLIA